MVGAVYFDSNVVTAAAAAANANATASVGDTVVGRSLTF